MEVIVGFVQLPARVGKGPPGRCADPEGAHELKSWQVALLVIFLQGRVHIEFWICDDLVAEAINDQSDGVDAPETFVKSALCHRYSSPSPWASCFDNTQAETEWIAALKRFLPQRARSIATIHQ